MNTKVLGDVDVPGVRVVDCGDGARTIQSPWAFWGAAREAS